MFGLFKKKETEKRPQLADLDNNILNEGDYVEALRYDLGKSKLILIDNDYYYQSEKNGEQVSWLKMIDASSERQKVKKILLE